MGLLYIEEPDHTGHMFGPDSQEVDAMLEKLNNVIGHLIKQLKDAELYDSMNIIITADHGMAELSEDRLVLLEEIDDLEELTDAKRTFITTTSAMIQPKNDTVKKIVYDVRDLKLNEISLHKLNNSKNRSMIILFRNLKRFKQKIHTLKSGTKKRFLKAFTLLKMIESQIFLLLPKTIGIYSVTKHIGIRLKKKNYFFKKKLFSYSFRVFSQF